MTATNNSRVKELSHNSVGMVFMVNTIILFIASLLVIYFVVQANVIAASSYKVSQLSQDLESLNEIRSSLAAQKSAMEDPSRVLEFALSQNMVEVKNATYIFENGNVALRP